MLIGLGCGSLPSNLAVPYRLAVVVVGEGPPALTVCDVETEIVSARANMEIRFIAFIIPTSIGVLVLQSQVGQLPASS